MAYPQSSPPVKMASLNNNLSELDTLLQDLSNARYAGYTERRGETYYSMESKGTNVNYSNGTPTGTLSGRPPSSQESRIRPSVDSLLDELNTAVPNGDMPDGRYHTTTINYLESTKSDHVGPPLGGASGGTGASSATKELDDLMASLSDFKVSFSLLMKRDACVCVYALSRPACCPFLAPHSRWEARNSLVFRAGLLNGGEGRGGLERLDDFLQDAGALSLQSHLSHASRQNLPGTLHITASSHQHQTVTDSPYAKPNKATKSSPSPQSTLRQPQHHQPTQAPSGKQNQLDSMLGNLQADMSRQGVNTTQKGCCNACDKPIVGQVRHSPVITALGKTWHPEHFTCNHCNQELGTRNFFERDGHPYCEPDYHNLFSPRCAYCNGPILDKCVTALEKTWHTEHFFCAQCGKQFGEDGFHERDGKPYCRDDYFDMFAPKCGGCNRPIMENYISALNSQWHADCFVCRDCRQPFHGGSFFDHEGLPYCETHYHAKRGSLCAGCHKPITGRCITAMFRKFHPEHFVCAFCLKQLNKGTFKEQNDKPYCHACFDKLFG
uniref:LIM zinc-binding domain-containing protein n=1 Tax=Timema cristinae TaxID=61476 RepID=A0A7R9CNM1_TIMCR|nr:unnamed protein product [Timema cristinae]